MIRVRLLKDQDALNAAVKASPRGIASLLMVVYHRGHRVGLRRINQGFQPTPWTCPRCKRAVGRDGLRYQWAVRR